MTRRGSSDWRERFYISDLDGTLLLPDKTLGPRTRGALERFIAAGGRFTIATGRSAPSAAARLHGVELPTSAIVHNGALTVNLNTGEVTKVSAMPSTLAARIFSRAVEEGLCPMVYGMAPDGEVQLFHGAEPNRASRRYLASLEAFHSLIPDDGGGLARTTSALAMILLDDPERIERYLARHCDPLPELATYPERSAYTPGLGVGEITSSTASKAEAALGLARELGLTPSSIVAFGDNLNDLPLLLAAGRAFCPPGAHPRVLARVSGRIGSATQEGVASYLEDLLQSDPQNHAPPARS
jgi:Cof subfamily protein (haloacid dehalogenase superfamily)